MRRRHSKAEDVSNLWHEMFPLLCRRLPTLRHALYSLLGRKTYSTRDIKKIRTKHTTASSVGANLDEQLTSGLLCDSVQSVCEREKVKQRIPIMRVTTERDGSGLNSGTY